MAEILQVMQNANNFEINGSKYIINVGENDIANSLALLSTANQNSQHLEFADDQAQVVQPIEEFTSE